MGSSSESHSLPSLSLSVQSGLNVIGLNTGKLTRANREMIDGLQSFHDFLMVVHGRKLCAAASVKAGASGYMYRNW